MSRARLRKALTSHDPADPAVVPLIEAHAARLEQLGEERWRVDAEAQARMLRSVQALYGLDAVTIAAGGWLDAKGCTLACDVIRRLRPVLGERAGIAVALPARSTEALTEILQAIGPEEPDLFLLAADDPIDPTLESIAEFYGAVLVPIGASASPGVVALAQADFVTLDDPPRGWLYTTRTELDPAADPQKVRAAIARDCVSVMALENGEHDRSVIVVGAGPVGLAAALALRSRGLAATILEADPEDRARPGSRAIYVHGSTLRVLERCCPGLGRALAERGIAWPTRRTLWRGWQVFERSYEAPADGALPHFTSLPQTEIEALLLEFCRRRQVELVWGARVRGVEDTAGGGMRIDVEGGSTWTAQYVIGADGARSAVREAIGAELEGGRSANSYVIVDVAEDPSRPLPIERVFHYEHPAVGGRNVLLVPFAGGWRADLQCNEDDDTDAFSSADGVRRWIAATLGPNYAERVTWVSAYQFLQVVAQRFVDHARRVLLVGEAAHLFAPFGARGMNSGIVDADRAAEAIAAAIAAKDPTEASAAIEGFEHERRAAAVWNRAAAGEALAHLRAPTLARRLRRLAAVLAAPFSVRAGEWLDRAPYGPAGGRPGGKY